MNPILMFILLIVGLGIFGRTMVSKIQLLKTLAPAYRFNRLKDRLVQMVVLAIGQKRLVTRSRERSSGIMHALIFWGFCILLVRSVGLYGEGFVKGFELPLLGGEHLLGYLYVGLKDITEGIVLIMVLFAFYRRLALKPERMKNTIEAYLILGLIGILMVSDLMYDGARENLVQLFGNPTRLHFFDHPQYGSEFIWTPVSGGVAVLISGLGEGVNLYVMTLMFWLHIGTQLIFLNMLPYGKHFHVITALPNVFLKSLDYPHEKPRLLDVEDEEAWEDEALGVNYIHQLDWKQGLDLFTCTECGRCKAVCPTYVTEKPLNLHDFNDQLKNALKEDAANVIERHRLLAATLKSGSAESSKAAELFADKQLVGSVIAEETLWACTTCRACEEVCPVAIEHVPRIIAMRQWQTLLAESYPKELNDTFKGLERNGNPWGIGFDKRADWAKGLGVTLVADNPDVEYLLWVGCAGSFDERYKKVSTSLVEILQQANVSFGILGVEEKCTGDFARRTGNEMMFQMLAQENIDTLNRYRVNKIITACPHCLNTLKHDYSEMGGNYEVQHHSEFIQRLIQDGKIRLQRSLKETSTYHDPCYLGRYNNIYEHPRSILRSVSKGGFQELERNCRESFCCGAGGGRMWMEETIGKRINLERVEEIVRRQVSTVAVSCPFCMTMIEDGMKDLGQEGLIKTLDIAEIVASNMLKGDIG